MSEEQQEPTVVQMLAHILVELRQHAIMLRRIADAIEAHNELSRSSAGRKRIVA